MLFVLYAALGVRRKPKAPVSVLTRWLFASVRDIRHEFKHGGRQLHNPVSHNNRRSWPIKICPSAPLIFSSREVAPYQTWGQATLATALVINR
jgi:hypothetical protein